MPFMDPGDGSLLTVAVPGSEEYAALGFGGETPVPLAASLSASGKSSHLFYCGDDADAFVDALPK